MTEGSTTSSLFEATRLGLARIALAHANELSRALERAGAASAQALGVERVGVWFYSRDGSELRCACLYELSRDQCSSGQVLPLAELPGYAEALQQHRVLAAEELKDGHGSAQLVHGYFEPLGIGSTLDSPVFRLGEVVGVLRHEHVGPPRSWSSRDRHFVASVADLMAVLLEQATRLDVEAALQDQKQRLVKAEKMEALSRLGAGVAHDFNNVLTAIMLKVETLRVDAPSGSALSDELSEILGETKRGARLVQQLLTFAKAKLPTPRPVDLTRTVRGMAPLLDALLRGKSRLLVEAPVKPLIVNVDPTQLEQVILNLVVNARDAMSETGGDIRLRLELEPDTALLSVTDAGPGLDEATREQVFEPFFTTKEQGSGLGLSTVHSIVEQSGGSISVESEPGRGATFSVRFPRIQ